MKKLMLVIWALVLVVFPFQHVAASDKIVDTWKGTLKTADGNIESEANYRYEMLDEGDYLTVRGQMAMRFPNLNTERNVGRAIFYYMCNKQQRLCISAASQVGDWEKLHTTISKAFSGVYMNNPDIVMSKLFGAATMSFLTSAHLREVAMPSVYSPELSLVSGDALRKELEKANNMLPSRYGSIYYYSLWAFVAGDKLAEAMQENAIKNRSAVVEELLVGDKVFLDSKYLKIIIEAIKSPGLVKRTFVLHMAARNPSPGEAGRVMRLFFPDVEDAVSKITKGLSDSDVQEDLKFLSRNDITADTVIETTCGTGSVRDFAEGLKNKAYRMAIKQGAAWKTLGDNVYRKAESCVDKVSHKYIKKVAGTYADMSCGGTSAFNCYNAKLNEHYWNIVDQYAKFVYFVIPEEKLSAECATISQILKIDGETVIARKDSYENICK